MDIYRETRKARKICERCKRSSTCKVFRRRHTLHIKFLSKVIVVFLLFLGMVMYSNEGQTKEK